MTTQHTLVWGLALMLVGGILASVGVQTARAGEPVLLVHGGATSSDVADVDPARIAAWKAGLNAAMADGYAILAGGGSALDAVEAAIVAMEDDPAFNAGRGAVFTADGRNELDASIMDGATLNAGAVANVTRVKNPIRLARSVMANSRHLMFVGNGAETFAESHDIDLVAPDYFRTDARWDQYQRALERMMPDGPDAKKGTVGAVALDRDGNLAAGTSTGGLMLKRWGRVGDSPIIGAGTYADNASCAVSATGQGEYFIRATVARDICARMELAGDSVSAAAKGVIHGKLTQLGGTGGVIVLDAQGNAAAVFNTTAMIRGRIDGSGATTAVFEPEE